MCFSSLLSYFFIWLSLLYSYCWPFTWASQGFAFIYIDFTIYIFLMFRLSLSFKEVFGFSLRCRLQPHCESLSLYNTPMSSSKILMWAGGRVGGGGARCDMDYVFKILHLLKLFSDFVWSWVWLQTELDNRRYCPFSDLKLHFCCTRVYTSDTLHSWFNPVGKSFGKRG